jgi:hypothetical protein
MTVKPNRYIRLAREYVELSNAHELERIFPMFAENAIYVSKVVGAFEGRDAIAAMMRGFFQRMSDVRWEVPAYAVSCERTVGFEFTRHFTDPEAGEASSVRGREIIEFDPDGRILRIEVE